MSEFACKVVRVRAVEPIPDADRIELAVVGDYRSVVLKGAFRPGDLAVYIPEAAIVPAWLLERMGLTGKLAGPSGDRVKAIRLRGCLSQGLLYASEPHGDGRCRVQLEGGNHAILAEGADAAEWLGITKYEPPIPSSMDGEVIGLYGHPPNYDIENLKAWPDVLEPGEPVVITEKIHGTFTCFGRSPGLDNPDLLRGNVFVASKGLGAKGLVFKWPQPENVYCQAYEALGDPFRRMSDSGEPVLLLGETFGPGVQDLHYGAKAKAFRVFDVRIGPNWLIDEDLDYFCARHLLDRVPVLYRGPWSRAIADDLVSGRETVSGSAAHMREGVVIRSAVERRHPELGRVQLKHVSADYLLRRGGTELA